MTQEDFLKLLNSSPAFKQLDARYQEDIFAATGEKMEKYVKIFASAKAIIQKAQEELVNKNNEVMRNLDVQFALIYKNKFKADEKIQKQKDEEILDQLINKLDSLK